MKRIIFAVAASGWQNNKWWVPFAGAVGEAQSDPSLEVRIVVKSQALPDHNKNHVAHMLEGMHDNRRGSLTDANRNAIVSEASDLDGDYIYWWDDDTVHPKGTLHRFLALDLPFVSGLYYLKQPPCPPVAYYKNEGGSYRPLFGFRRGELVEVDSVGMGCALIKREVYEAIRAGHDVYERPNFSLLALPRSAQEFDVPSASVHKHIERLSGKVVNGHYMQPVKRLDDAYVDEHKRFPYYALEYDRTEDHHFCELAANVGIKPVVDTDINCQHWGMRPITRASFLESDIDARRELEERRAAS